MKKFLILTSILLLFVIALNAKELKNFSNDFNQVEKDLKISKQVINTHTKDTVLYSTDKLIYNKIISETNKNK